MMNNDFLTLEIGKTKHIALVAHDGKKKNWLSGAIRIKRF